MSPFVGERFDVAEAALGRDSDGLLLVEAVRPKSDTWRVEVEHGLARSPLGQVARHHFDEGDLEGDVWLVAHKYAEGLVEILANHDAEGLLALVVTKLITN